MKSWFACKLNTIELLILTTTMNESLNVYLCITTSKPDIESEARLLSVREAKRGGSDINLISPSCNRGCDYDNIHHTNVAYQQYTKVC